MCDNVKLVTADNYRSALTIYIANICCYRYIVYICSHRYIVYIYSVATLSSYKAENLRALS